MNLVYSTISFYLNSRHLSHADLLQTSITSSKIRISTLLVLDESAQHVEVVGEGLASAAGVSDCHGHVGAGSEGEGHGHPVVIVGVDCRDVQLLRWSDDAVVWPFFNRCSQLAQGKKNDEFKHH